MGDSIVQTITDSSPPSPQPLLPPSSSPPPPVQNIPSPPNPAEVEQNQAAAMMESRWLKFVFHACHCLAMVATVSGFAYLQGGFRFTNWDPNLAHIDPVADYGLFGAIVLYALRCFAILVFPQLVFNFVGLIVYNVFPGKVSLNSSPLLAPLISFRVVTRGDYPELVRNNVARNVSTIIDSGLENYVIEVVTDKSIDLPTKRRIREIVVPKQYKPKSGAKFKARALQYCLEDNVNELSGNDWIVHLDEETLLTPNSVRGILNFVCDGTHAFGQGLITYGNGTVVNWITTLADSIRVSDDIGKLRLQFKKFHRPLFSFKGSYVVSRVSAERAIGFDNGIDGSIAEDCYFAMLGASHGYTFDFVDGEMHEKSPFTVKDFIQQRKRWLQGLLLVVHSDGIPWRSKYLLAMSVYATVTVPLSISNILWAGIFPIPCPLALDLLLCFIGGTSVYMYLFGVIKTASLSPRSRGWIKTPLCLVGVIVLLPVFVILEMIAVVWGIFGKKHIFHVVEKNVDEKEPLMV